LCAFSFAHPVPTFFFSFCPFGLKQNRRWKKEKKKEKTLPIYPLSFLSSLSLSLFFYHHLCKLGLLLVCCVEKKINFKTQA